MIKDEKITLENIEKRLERIEKLLGILIDDNTIIIEEKKRIEELDKFVEKGDLSKQIKMQTK